MSDLSSRLEVIPDLEELRGLREWLESSLSDRPDQIDAVELALQELAVNSIEHGGLDTSGIARIVFTADLGAFTTVVTMTDPGREVPCGLLGGDFPAEPTVGGYGLILVGQLASDVSVRREGGLNIWRLEFPL